MALAKVLDKQKIILPEWDQRYKTLPKVTRKAPCVRIWLSEDGSVRDFEALSGVQVAELRKYGNNQSSFPAFNINALYRITDKKSIEELKSIENGQIKPDIKKIELWCKEDNWIKGASKQVQRSLSTCSQELMKEIGIPENIDKISVPKELAVIKKLGSLCNIISDKFKVSLKKCIFNKLKQDEDIKLALGLLFYKGKADKEHTKDIGHRFSVILDVYKWKSYGEYPVASKQTTEKINKLLLANSKMKETEESEETDAFGLPFVNLQKPMPNVKFCGFNVTLRSMFHGQPCQYRYGKIEDSSYPISAVNRTLIKKALEWVAAPDQRRITWEKIDKDEILFVYPSKLPEIRPKFASIFGYSQNDTSKNTESRFEDLAKEFTNTLRGLPVSQKPDIMQIFVLRKIDKARSKVILTHNSTPEQLISAADKWSQGCHNLPKLDIDDINTPFPLEIATIINAVWKQDGQRADGKSSVKRVQYYQGVELLLDILPKSVVHNFLHIALVNSSGLINYFGNNIHGTATSKDKGEFDLNKKIGQLYSTLGLLLYEYEGRRVNYMDELAYLIGELLHVSDELHTLYCNIKRDGDIPPQLAGSALFVTAGEMPYQALSQLSTRMAPYIAWAKQYRYKNIKTEKQESWRAGWLLGLFCQLCNEISLKMDKAIRFGDFERAKLFIGYMASLPKHKTKGKENSNSDINEGGIGNV